MYLCSTGGWLAQLARASALQAGGHRFESYITQWVKKSEYSALNVLFFWLKKSDIKRFFVVIKLLLYMLDSVYS